MARTSTTPLTAPVTSDVIRTKNTEIINRINDIDTWGAVAPTYNYIQNGDPGAVGANKSWVNTTVSPYVVSIRNTANTGWVVLSGSGGGGTDIPMGMSGVVGLEGLTWAPAFGRHPKVTNFVPTSTVLVTSDATWNSAIAALGTNTAGKLIQVQRNVTLNKLNFSSMYISNKDGTASQPFMIEFLPGAKITGATVDVNGNAYAIVMNTCSNFIIKGLQVTLNQKGLACIWCTTFYIDSPIMYNLGEDGLKIGAGSTFFDVWNPRIWETGNRTSGGVDGRQYGEACYIGFDEGQWNTVIFPSLSNIGQDATRYGSIRQGRFGPNITREATELKPVRDVYVIGCTADGAGYYNDGIGYSRSPFMTKGRDCYWYWNEVFNPNEYGFHITGAASGNISGTGPWGTNQTFFGNIVHQDASTSGAGSRYAIGGANTGDGHVIYDTNMVYGGTGLIAGSATVTQAASY